MWCSRGFAQRHVQMSQHADAQRKIEREENARKVVRDKLGMATMTSLKQDEIDQIASLIAEGMHAETAYSRVTGKVAVAA